MKSFCRFLRIIVSSLLIMLIICIAITVVAVGDGSYIFEDNNLGIKLKAPTGWKPYDAPVEDGGTGAQFVNSVTNGLITFTCIDKWSTFSNENKAKYPRDVLNNDFWADVLTKNGHEFERVVYNGTEYLKWGETKEKAESKEALYSFALTRLADGCEFNFYYSGYDYDSDIIDFEGLVNSVDYSGLKLTSDSVFAGNLKIGMKQEQVQEKLDCKPIDSSINNNGCLTEAYVVDYSMRPRGFDTEGILEPFVGYSLIMVEYDTEDASGTIDHITFSVDDPTFSDASIEVVHHYIDYYSSLFGEYKSDYDEEKQIFTYRFDNGYFLALILEDRVRMMSVVGEY